MKSFCAPSAFQGLLSAGTGGGRALNKTDGNRLVPPVMKSVDAQCAGNSSQSLAMLPGVKV